MNANRIFILIVLASVLLAAFALLPRADERLAMVLRGGDDGRALIEFETLYANGDRRPQLLAALAKLHEEAADPRGALGYLNAYLIAKPKDDVARQKQAELSLLADDKDGYFAAEKTLVLAKPTEERVTRLLSSYRLNGRFDDEVALMRRLEESRAINYADLQRLGSILAGRDEFSEAAKVLTLADARAPKDQAEPRLLLFNILLQQHRPEDALALGRRLIPLWHSTYLSGQLVLRAARYRDTALSSALVAAAAEAVPASEFAILGLLNSEGRSDMAQRLVADFSKRLPGAEPGWIQRYAAAAIASGDPSAPVRALGMLLRTHAPPATIATLSETLALTFGTEVLAPFRNQLSYDMLASRPLFAAEFAAREGNADLARRFLMRSNPKSLKSAERDRWLATARKYAPQLATNFANLSAERLAGSRTIAIAATTHGIAIGQIPAAGLSAVTMNGSSG